MTSKHATFDSHLPLYNGGNVSAGVLISKVAYQLMKTVVDTFGVLESEYSLMFWSICYGISSIGLHEKVVSKSQLSLIYNNCSTPMNLLFMFRVHLQLYSNIRFLQVSKWEIVFTRL